MPTEVIVQNLQNPTGAVPTYLLAGELGRRQKMEAEAAAQMPNNTVTEQLVQESAPQQALGQMAPQAMAPMPVPPEQSGVANLPAPNVGQNYAGGGIVSFADGGGIPGITPRRFDPEQEDGFSDLFDIAMWGKKLSPIAAALYSSELNAGEDEILAKRLEEAGRLQEGQIPSETETMIEEAMAEDDSMADEAALGGAGLLGLTAAAQNKKTPKKKTPKIKTPKGGKAGLLTGIAAYVADKAAKAKAAVTPKPTPKKGPGRPKKTTPPPPSKGPLTQATIAGIKAIPKGVGPLTRGAKTALTRYPVETGLGALGLNALLNEGVLYGTDPAEIARQDLEKTTKAELEQAREDRKREEDNAKHQAYLDNLQAKKDKQKQKEMFLALALGGAKAMQGESPYALQNIGAGLEGGVSALSAFDIARADREADLTKARYDREFNLLRIQQDQQATYNKAIADLMESQEYGDYVRALQQQVDDETIDESDMQVELIRWLDTRAEQLGITSPSKKQTTVNGREFSAI